MAPSNKDAKLNELLQALSAQLGESPNELQKEAQEGNVDHLLGKLSDSDAQKVKRVLSDKNATEKLLSSKQAQALLKQLMGGK